MELSYDDYGCEYITEKQYHQYLKIFREGKDALENYPKTVNEITHSILRTMMNAVSSDRRQWEFEALSPEEQEAEKKRAEESQKKWKAYIAELKKTRYHRDYQIDNAKKPADPISVGFFF